MFAGKCFKIPPVINKTEKAIKHGVLLIYEIFHDRELNVKRRVVFYSNFFPFVAKSLLDLAPKTYQHSKVSFF